MTLRQGPCPPGTQHLSQGRDRKGVVAGGGADLPAGQGAVGRRQHPVICGPDPLGQQVSAPVPIMTPPKALPTPGVRVPPGGFSGLNKAPAACTGIGEALGALRALGAEGRGAVLAAQEPSGCRTRGWAAPSTGQPRERHPSHHPNPQPGEEERGCPGSPGGRPDHPPLKGKDPGLNSLARTEVETPRSTIPLKYYCLL